MRPRERYLTGGTQYVAFNGAISDIHYEKWGVPQGSIPGPLLVILYINDISSVSKLLITLLYSDDTCVKLLGEKYLNTLVPDLKDIGIDYHFFPAFSPKLLYWSFHASFPIANNVCLKILSLILITTIVERP